MSGYRQARDPREIAAELYHEALEREARATAQKCAAEAALTIAEHEREIALSVRGGRVEVRRHLTAMANASSAAGVALPDDAARIAQLEGEIAAADAEVTAAEVKIAESRRELSRALDVLGDASGLVEERRHELERGGR